MNKFINYAACAQAVRQKAKEGWPDIDSVERAFVCVILEEYYPKVREASYLIYPVGYHHSSSKVFIAEQLLPKRLSYILMHNHPGFSPPSPKDISYLERLGPNCKGSVIVYPDWSYEVIEDKLEYSPGDNFWDMVARIHHTSPL